MAVIGHARRVPSNPAPGSRHPARSSSLSSLQQHHPRLAVNILSFSLARDPTTATNVKYLFFERLYRKMSHHVPSDVAAILFAHGAVGAVKGRLHSGTLKIGARAIPKRRQIFTIRRVLRTRPGARHHLLLRRAFCRAFVESNTDFHDPSNLSRTPASPQSSHYIGLRHPTDQNRDRSALVTSPPCLSAVSPLLTAR
ncbi:hypothetical protein VTI74DRAFT_8848 [Chaetomium olivicolor]